MLWLACPIIRFYCILRLTKGGQPAVHTCALLAENLSFHVHSADKLFFRYFDQVLPNQGAVLWLIHKDASRW